MILGQELEHSFNLGFTTTEVTRLASRRELLQVPQQQGDEAQHVVVGELWFALRVHNRGHMALPAMPEVEVSARCEAWSSGTVQIVAGGVQEVQEGGSTSGAGRKRTAEDGAAEGEPPRKLQRTADGVTSAASSAPSSMRVSTHVQPGTTLEYWLRVVPPPLPAVLTGATVRISVDFTSPGSGRALTATHEHVLSVFDLFRFELVELNDRWQPVTDGDEVNEVREGGAMWHL